MSMKNYDPFVTVDELSERLQNYSIIIDNHWEKDADKKKMRWSPGLRKMKVSFNDKTEVFDDDDLVGIANFYNTGTRNTQ